MYQLKHIQTHSNGKFIANVFALIKITFPGFNLQGSYTKLVLPRI
jgi:hypothetical protein